MESFTFSLRAYSDDCIGALYKLSRALRVTVTSVFRQNLLLYETLLQLEQETMNQKESAVFDELVRILSMSHIVRSEGVPDKGTIIDYVRIAEKPALIPMITSASPVRLFLIIDRARTQAGRIGEKLKESA